MPDLAPETPRPDEDRAAPPPSSGVIPADLPPAPAPSSDARDSYLPSRKRQGVALCLSGGGYRAALFHLGALRRINELGALGKVDTITSVSGGSILSAHLAASIGDRWPLGGAVLCVFDGVVARPFHKMASRNIRTWPRLSGLVPWNLFRGHAAVTALEAQSGPT